MLKLISLLLLTYKVFCQEFKTTISLHSINGSYQSQYLRNLQYSAPIYGNTSVLNYYYVDLYVGNPPQRQSLIIDTGSLLTTIPCMPFCESCGHHINSYYNFTGIIYINPDSTTASEINCSSNECQNFYGNKCYSNRCVFDIVCIINLSNMVKDHHSLVSILKKK
jgi:hypothetical protein